MDPTSKAEPPIAAVQQPQHRTRTIAKNSFWMGIDQLFGIVGGIIASILVARRFGPTELAYYNYMLWLVTLTAVAVGRDGLHKATKKYMADYIETGQYALCRNVLNKFFLLQTGIAILCLLIAIPLILASVPQRLFLIGIVGALSMAPSILLSIPSAANMAIEDFTSNVKASAVGNLLNTGGMFLTLAVNGTLLGLTLSLLISRAVDFGIRYWYFRKNYNIFYAQIPSDLSKEKVPSPEWRRILSFAFQSVFLLLLNLVVWDRSEILFLKVFSPIEQLAFYSVPFSMVQHGTTLYQVFAAAAGMSMLRRHVTDKEGANRMASSMLRYMALIAFPMTMGLAAVSEPFMTVIYGPKYLAAIPVLLIVGLMGCARALLMPLEQYVVVTERQDLLIKGTLITSAINIGLALLLIPPGGAVGAALCNGFSQIIGVFICWKLLTSVFQIRIPWPQLLRILAASLSMFGATYCVTLVLPPLPGLLVGVFVGALAYLLFLRLYRCLNGEDEQRLKILVSHLPGPFRGMFSRLLHLLFPATPAQTA